MCNNAIFFSLVCSFLWIFYFFNSLLEMTRSRSTNMRNSITKKSQDITRQRTIQSSSPSPIGSTHTQTSTPVPPPVPPNTSLPPTPQAATIATPSSSLHSGLQAIAIGAQFTDSSTALLLQIHSLQLLHQYILCLHQSLRHLKNRLRVYLLNNL